ncbi:hypothetical protein ABID58_007235 [Bradyrhizobium sp. S3.2.6]
MLLPLLAVTSSTFLAGRFDMSVIKSFFIVRSDKIVFNAPGRQAETCPAKSAQASRRGAGGRSPGRSFPAQATIMVSAQDVNVPDKVPLSVQATMKKDLREVYWARAQRPPKRRPTSSPRRFARRTAGRWNAWSGIATHCCPSRIFLPHIGADLSTTNPIERVSAAGRYRTVRTKGSLSPTTARPMVFKLVIAASRTWRRLKKRKSVAEGRRNRRIQRRH